MVKTSPKIFVRQEKAVLSLSELSTGKSERVISLTGIGGIQRFSLPSGETPEIVRFDHHLTLHQAGRIALSSTHDGHRLSDQIVEPGQIHFRPSLVPHQSRWQGETQITVIALDRGFVQTCAADLFKQDLNCLEFQAAIAQTDSLAWSLGTRIADLCSRDGVPYLFIEEMATTLAMHLLLTYGQIAAETGKERVALTQSVLKRIDDYINAHLAETISLQNLATVAGLSKYHFARQFKKETGRSPGQYVLAQKMQAARVLLGDRSRTITDIATSVGYTNISHFSRAFSSQFGLSPSAFRQQL